MNCPKCSEQVLVRSDYQSPHKCNHCGGSWLRAREISRLPEMQSEKDESPWVASQGDSRTGLCPEGHGIMLRAKIDLDEPFYLERCSDCGGLWFDKGELEQIVANNFTSLLPDLWSDSWQRKQREKESKGHYWEINRKLLGEDVFNQIVELSNSLSTHPEKDRALAFLRQVVRNPK